MIFLRSRHKLIRNYKKLKIDYKEIIKILAKNLILNCKKYNQNKMITIVINSLCKIYKILINNIKDIKMI